MNQNLAAVVFVVGAFASGVASPVLAQQIGQARRTVLQPSAMVQQPSSTDIINKMLSPGPSDPSVPLPRLGLSDKAAEAAPSHNTRIYGRAEGDGGVVGF